MTRRPRGHQGLFPRRLQLALVLIGLAVGLAATAAYVVGRQIDPEAAQTMAFATLAIAELLLVFSIRSGTSGLARPAQRRARRQRARLVGVCRSGHVRPRPPRALRHGRARAGRARVVASLALVPAALVEAVKRLRGHESAGKPQPRSGAAPIPGDRLRAMLGRERIPRRMR